VSDAGHLPDLSPPGAEGPTLIPNTVHTIFLDAGDTLIAYRRPLRILLQDFFIEHGEIVRRDRITEALQAMNVRYRAVMDTIRTVEQERRLWMEVARDLLDLLLPGRRDLSVRLGRWFSESWHLMKVFPDVRPAMHRLRRSGYQLAVVSNWEPSLEEVLDHLGLRVYFTAVVTSSVEGIWKPDPRLFELALRRCGLRPEEAVSVGDDIERDLAAAARAGLAGILLDRFGDHPEYTPRVEHLGALADRLPARLPLPR